MPWALAATFWLWDWKVAYPPASASSRGGEPPSARRHGWSRRRRGRRRGERESAASAVLPRKASVLPRRHPAVGEETGVAEVEPQVHATPGLGGTTPPARQPGVRAIPSRPESLPSSAPYPSIASPSGRRISTPASPVPAFRFTVSRRGHGGVEGRREQEAGVHPALDGDEAVPPDRGQTPWPGGARPSSRGGCRRPSTRSAGGRPRPPGRCWWARPSGSPNRPRRPSGAPGHGVPRAASGGRRGSSRAACPGAPRPRW